MSNLFDRKRYKFDEDDLFSHSHEKKLETKKFPWYKPVWNEQLKEWEMFNPDGKLLEFGWVTETMPNHMENLVSAKKYWLSSVFFVDWVKKVTYYQGVFLWNNVFNDVKSVNPSMKDEKVAKFADTAVEAFFEGLR